MRINSIEIKNFRQYKNLTFKFPYNPDHDLHIIIAENGIGKTNLLNSISWCLYEKEYHLGDESRSLPQYNIEAIKEAKKNGKKTLDVSVSIYIEDGNTKIIFSRKAELIVNSGFLKKPEFNVSISSNSGDYDIYSSDEADVYVRKYLPENIRQYFFFDGEQLHNYFTRTQDLKIEKSIEEISQVDMLIRMVERLGVVIKEKQKEASNQDSTTNHINQEIEKLESIIDERKERIDKLNEQINKSQEIIETNTNRLSGMNNLPELENKFQNLSKEFKRLTENSLKINSDIYRFIRESKVNFAFYKPAFNVLNLIRENRENLPPTIDRNLLITTLKNHRCLICDHELSEENEKRINEILETIKVGTNTSSMLVSIENELNRIVNYIDIYTNKKDRLITDKRECDNRINQIKIELNELDSEINKYSQTDKKDIASWHQERNEHIRLLEINRDKCAVEKNALNKDYQDLEELNKRLKRAIKAQDYLNNLYNQIENANKAQKIVNEIKNEMMYDVRIRTEERTTEIFKSLIWKNNTYSKIELNDNYQLDLIHVDGYSCVGSCSAAERALLALSFTLALHEVSGFNTLLFIDTPVARVSGDNRLNFSKILNDVSCNKQLIMTFTKDEYSESIKNTFEKDCKNFIRLNTVDERITQQI